MTSVDRILGESTDHEAWKAYRHAKDVIKGRCPEDESIIVNHPILCIIYARDVIKGRWPEAEATFVKDPEWAYLYARDVIRGRWPEAEATIANSKYRDYYIRAFPEAKDDWALNGLIDWLDT